MDRLEAMALFSAIAEAGSLTAAARARRVPLATLSRKLNALESHLGTRLLARTTRRLALTDAGRRYLEACRRILADVDESEAWVAGEHAAPRGLLHLTAPIVFGRLHVLPVVLDLLSREASLQVRLVLSDRNVDLVEDGIDAAIRIGELPDSGLVAIQLGTIRRIVCASPAYLRRHGPPRAPGDLVRHATIGFEPSGHASPWTFPGAASVRVSPRLVVTTAEAAIDAAVSGLGLVRVLSYQARAALADGALVDVLARHAPPPIPVQLVRLADRHAPAKLRAFIDLAAPALREVLRMPRRPPPPADRRGVRAAAP